MRINPTALKAKAFDPLAGGFVDQATRFVVESLDVEASNPKPNIQ